MPHHIREQIIRQRLNWFRKVQELRSGSDVAVILWDLGIDIDRDSRPTTIEWKW